MLCDDKCQPGSEGVRLDLAPKNMTKLLKTLYYRYITDDFFFSSCIHQLYNEDTCNYQVYKYFHGLGTPGIVQGNLSLLYNYLRYDDKFQSMSYHLN